MDVNELQFRRHDAAEYLTKEKGCPHAAGTLAKLATFGGGPQFYKSGKYAIYPQSALDAYAEARRTKLVRSTSELKVLQEQADRAEQGAA
jgi:hypothetical protein